jgi:hypothetical protein
LRDIALGRVLKTNDLNSPNATDVHVSKFRSGQFLIIESGKDIANPLSEKVHTDSRKVQRYFKVFTSPYEKSLSDRARDIDRLNLPGISNSPSSLSAAAPKSDLEAALSSRFSPMSPSIGSVHKLGGPRKSDSASIVKNAISLSSRKCTTPHLFGEMSQ